MIFKIKSVVAEAGAGDVHGPDADPGAGGPRRQVGQGAQPLLPAHPRHRRRADQPRRLGLVLPHRRRRPVHNFAYKTIRVWVYIDNMLPIGPAYSMPWGWPASASHFKRSTRTVCLMSQRGRRCPVVDTWWQTETGSIMISNLPGAWGMKPGSASLPFFSVAPAILDDKVDLLNNRIWN